MRKPLRVFAAAFLCLCLVFPGALAQVETDEEGGTWDYDQGIYTDPNGQTHVITPEGVAEDDGPVTVQNEDGSMTVITSDQNDVTVNEDGSITVESGQIQIIEPETTRGPLTAEEWEQRLQHASVVNGAYTPTVYKNPQTGEVTEVTVRYMGIGRSMVVLNGVETLVNTVDLEWLTEAPADKVLAVIDTPRNGYAAMYAGKSKKTTLIKQCRLDQVVRVISTGKNWTMIDHDGTRGYVQTSSLEFYTNDHVEFDPGLLSVKGRVKGKDSANIRSRDKTHRNLCSYALGTPLTVFDIVDEWAEVDVCGWHCVINSKCLTLEHELETASSR